MGRKRRKKLDQRERSASEPDPSIMEMAEMGYAVIDRQGRIRERQIDRQFGEHVGAIVHALRQAKNPA